eukprot:7379299-Prymnesium_polylepis.2
MMRTSRGNGENDGEGRDHRTRAGVVTLRTGCGGPPVKPGTPPLKLGTGDHTERPACNIRDRRPVTNRSQKLMAAVQPVRNESWRLRTTAQATLQR